MSTPAASSPPDLIDAEPPAPPGPWGAMLALVDAPARQAFLLARRPWAAAGISVAALTVVLAGCLGAAWLTPDPGARAASLALLRGAGWSLAMVVPSAAIFGAYARLSVSPAAWGGALAVSLVTAAVVLLSTAPLLVYFALVAKAAPWVTPSLLLSMVVLVAIGATLGRVLQAADPGPRGAWAARLVGHGLGGAFFMQVLTDEAMQAFLHTMGA